MEREYNQMSPHNGMKYQLQAPEAGIDYDNELTGVITGGGKSNLFYTKSDQIERVIK